MRAELTSAQAAFKDQVGNFLEQALPVTLADKVRHNAPISKAELTDWTRVLNARGWAAPNWPAEHGGTDWTLVQRQIFDTQCRLAHAPVLSGFGFNMVGPAIIRYGTAEQQAQFLPATRNADLWWCQGYSEPGAGSDLASLSTRAIRDGDSYRVTGQKIWTSGAELADWMFALVRTDPEVQQQRGISFLLIDLRSAGVRIEPLYALNGKRLWNQVFLDEVRVPMSQRLGEENRGWTVAKSLLGDERLLVSRVSENKRMLSVISDLTDSMDAQLSAHDLGALRGRIDSLQVRLRALEATSLRLLTMADAGDAVGAEPSMLKLKGSELVQAMDEALMDLLAYFTLPVDRSTTARLLPGVTASDPVTPAAVEYLASGYFHHRGYTIAGGASEVQHNIIAKQVLGL
ncbi:MAG: acyl-CoA dehydrogenase family protein [Pseudomonadales bacterium]